jgi:hypothetical protein
VSRRSATADSSTVAPMSRGYDADVSSPVQLWV